ncbi:MAG: GNAT family N-acetyltransferase [Candidatus Heimdallarchaeota archaeon]
MGQSKVAVHPTIQRQKTATKLINAAFELAIKQKVDAIQLFTYNENIPAKRLMEKLDFKHEPLFYYPSFFENTPFAHDSVPLNLIFPKNYQPFL